MPLALLVIYRSPNGRDPWTPVPPQDVPAWVKDERNVAQMIAGEMCFNCDDLSGESAWYRAERHADV
ncbi:MAG: hypothetical protein A3E01_08260 [Gammaproteobacteria bacterium RIFCSPHIGHO2_12_FULL_63_22]|nr:MAG: hypothetical protein A3E01_08260 [Gammaproteobacteria bacterium RIFCSPHIGHO2_12_FULL_63_22]